MPDPSSNQLLVRVGVAGLAHPDVLRRRGRYQDRSEGGFTLGSELAGHVVTAPPNCGFSAGDRVAAVTGTGAAAEFAVVDVHAALRVPDDVPLRVAAAAALNFLTARFALLDRGRLRPGDDVLVLGAGGGVGNAATQLAVAHGANRVAAAASSADKLVTAGFAGASLLVLSADVAELAYRFDILLDPVGGEIADAALPLLRPFGRHVAVGFASGELTTVTLNRAVFRNLEHIGAGWGAFAETHSAEVRTAWTEIATMLADGRLSPWIGAAGTLDDVERMLDELESRRALGKSVVIVAEDIM